MHRKAIIRFKGMLLFLHVTYMKNKQMRVFHFIFDLLWRGRGFSVTSVAFKGSVS